MNAGSTAILEAASEFLWSEQMQDSLEAFTTNYASMFEGATWPAEEQRLEWGEAHRDFQQLFELQLEQFVVVQEFSAEEFVAACQDAIDNASFADGKGLVEVVMAMSTYDYFIKMMIAASEPDPFDRSDDCGLAADADVGDDDSEFM